MDPHASQVVAKPAPEPVEWPLAFTIPVWFSVFSVVLFAMMRLFGARGRGPDA